LWGVLVLLVIPGAATAGGRASAPLSPREELATFRLADPGLTVDLVAAEPDVVSPVAIAWDEDGRLFVAEMTDYPTGPASGRVRLLEDRDGDGRFDRVTMFAEGLAFPTGVLPWGGGVLVTAAPDVLFFQDRDGDGRADHRRTVLTGFGQGNQQLRVNGLTWGLDNWVYGANGRSDGEVRRPDEPAGKAVSIRRRDFRFRPSTGEVEPVAGFSQFGLPRDDWGHRFPSWNTIPIRHVVIEERALSRNPYLAQSSSVASILDPSDRGRVYPISPAQATFNRESTAHFNASCGPTIYRADALGGSYRGNAFVCESLTNLVHRRVLEPAGPTFLARRVEQGREFLVSSDPCFRPVNLATGPDGALYVVDFYREMVEHPQFVPGELREAVDFRRWNDRGRIWRVVPEAGLPEGRSRAPRLGKARSSELVALLGHPNGWWRDTAQRLLVERQDRSSIAALTSQVLTSESPLARLHALWTLEGLNALGEATLARALHDTHPGARASAAELAARRPGLTGDLLPLADDPEIRVRVRAAIALGDVDDERAGMALARIAARDVGDEWARLAVLSGLHDKAWPFLQALLAADPGWLEAPTAAQGTLLAQTGAILGARHQTDELRGLAARLAPGPGGQAEGGRIALLAGLADGMARAGEPLRSLLANPPPGWRGAMDGIAALLDRARDVAGSRRASPERRALALTVLARCRPDAAADRIVDLLAPTEPDAVRSAAARAIADVGSRDLAAKVLGRWGGLATDTRREVLAAMLSSTALTSQFVDALEDDTIAATELEPAVRDALRVTPDKALRERAAVILARSAAPDRRDVVRSFQPALSLPADARRGAELFAKHCQTCHQRHGQGRPVGPDLSGVAGRPPATLLKDILDPNGDVSPDFVNFLVVTRRGQVLSGLLVEETGASLKLRRAEGAEETVLRSEVEVLRSSSRSLMPEGLEQALGVQGVADVIAFLKQP
jgi:putative membrane-bound dehydrogenase-like protein